MAAQSSIPTVSAFPFLTVEEFRHACCYFLEKIRKFENSDDFNWSSIRLVEMVIIHESHNYEPIEIWLCANSYTAFDTRRMDQFSRYLEISTVSTPMMANIYRKKPQIPRTRDSNVLRMILSVIDTNRPSDIP